MSTEEEKYFVEDSGNAEASHTFPAQANTLRKGGYAILKSHPCLILDISTSQPGKHGHAKCTFRGRDIFTGAAVEDSHPSTHKMDVPFVTRTEYDLSYVTNDGFLCLLTTEGGEKQDVKLPEGVVGEKIKAYLDEEMVVNVTILSAMGKELCVAAKGTAD